MSKKKRILVVDDELNIRRILQASLDKAGFCTVVSESGEAALEAMEAEPADCVLTDVTMPGMDGYELQRTVHGRWPDVPVIIMTAFGTIPQAVQSIREGAFEYVTKPFDLDVVKKIIKAALKYAPGEGRSKRPAKAKPSKAFVADSPSMIEVVETIRQVADSRATILVTGETGTGKEIVGRLLHDYSRRAAEPYVAVSCAALPETLLESELFGYVKGAFTGADSDKPGRFEIADKGTLFLDEVGDIPVTTQVKLLRVLQERQIERLGATEPTAIDVRLVAATNRSLSSAVEDGKFRLDLLYRLQVVEIDLPPLRRRLEDVLPLAKHFLAKFSEENGKEILNLSDEALAVMRQYGWPGNVREMENAMERAVVLAEPGHREVLVAHLPRQLKEAA